MPIDSKTNMAHKRHSTALIQPLVMIRDNASKTEFVIVAILNMNTIVTTTNTEFQSGSAKHSYGRVDI